jgi:hypothetical protein
MGFFSWLTGKRHATEPKPAPSPFRLVWFELQVCPFEFRLAIIPGQPVLIGYGSGNGEEGQTALMPYEGNEKTVDWLIDSLDARIRTNRIFETPPLAAEQAFTDAAMQTPSLHIRAAYADDKRWAAVFPLNGMPANVQALLEETRQLGKQVIERQKLTALPPESALAMVDSVKNAEAPRPAAVVAKVKVTRSGNIFVNGRPMKLQELTRTFQLLKEKGGAVWYHREDAAGDPPAEAIAVIKAVTEAKLPIRLCEEDFGD